MTARVIDVGYIELKASYIINPAKLTLEKKLKTKC